MQPLSGKLHIDKRNRFNNYNVEDGRYEQRTGWLRSITDYRLTMPLNCATPSTTTKANVITATSSVTVTTPTAPR